MTSIKLDDVKGLMIAKVESVIVLLDKEGNEFVSLTQHFRWGWNKSLDQQSQRKITLNRERLIATCSQYFVDLGHAAIKAKLKNSKMVISPARGLADAIIKELPDLVEVVE